MFRSPFAYSPKELQTLTLFPDTLPLTVFTPNRPPDDQA